MTSTSADQPTVPMVVPPPGDLIGTIVADRYQVEALVGVGGMARVYRAEDLRLGRPVALKIFSQDSPTASDLRRQEAEVRTAASLQHPAIVTLYDIASRGASPALVMQFVDSETLSARLNRGAMDVAATRQVGLAIAGALVYLHDRGIMHRDVKPGNVLLPRNGEPPAMLSDFGIARMVDASTLTTVGTVIGSASYLSPEQARGHALTPATDIYSLGLVLIESLTGARCFPGTALESAAARLSRDPDVPDHIGGAWQSLLRRMTAQRPEDRPGAREVVAELEVPREHAEPRTQVQPVSAPRSRRRVWIPAVVVAAVLLGGGAATWAVTTSQSPPPAGVEYPAVEGLLGEHLQQLQEAVTP